MEDDQAMLHKDDYQPLHDGSSSYTTSSRRASASSNANANEVSRMNKVVSSHGGGGDNIIIAPTPLSRGEYLRLNVQMVVSNHTVVPFRFYDLPGCLSPILARSRENYRKIGGRIRKKDRQRSKMGGRNTLNYGERDDTTLSNIFLGDDIRRPAPFSIKALQDQPCTPLCHSPIDGNGIRQLRQLIQQEYRVQMTYGNDTIAVKMEHGGELGYPLGFLLPSEQTLHSTATARRNNETATATSSTANIEKPQYSRYKSYKYGYYNHFEFRITYQQDKDGTTSITDITVNPVSINHKYIATSSKKSGGGSGSGASASSRWPTSSRFDTCRHDQGNGLAAAISHDPDNAALWLPTPKSTSTTREKLEIVYSYQVRWIKKPSSTSSIVEEDSNMSTSLTSNHSQKDVATCGDHLATNITMLLAVIVPIFVLWTTRRKDRSSSGHHRKKEDKEIELQPLKSTATTYLNEDDKIDPKDLVLADFDWPKEDEPDLFVATPLPPAICQLSGLGAQIFVTMILLIVASDHIHHRPIIHIIWCTFAVCGFISGYVSSRLQELFLVSSSDRWMQILWCAVLANIAASMVSWALLVLRDVLLYTSGAATLSSVGTLFILICVSTVIQIPLAIFGVYIGHRSQKTAIGTSQSVLDHSVSTLSSDEGTGHLDEDDMKKRIVKPDPRYIVIARNLAGGIIPFGAMHRAWFVWITTLWNTPNKGLFHGTCQLSMSRSLMILIALCFESCVLVSCIDWSLKREQYAYHHQWWRSFWNGASIGIFFFFYLLHIGWDDFQLLGSLTQVLYFGVSGVLSVLLGLVCGCFGVLSSLGFATYLFYYKKNGR